MLYSRYAVWMAWGPELTFFCNDAYLPTVGIKRDWVLGRKGTELIVTLPLAVSERTESDLVVADNNTALQTKLRILVADDNVDSATTLAQLLELDGYETHREQRRSGDRVIR